MSNNIDQNLDNDQLDDDVSYDDDSVPDNDNTTTNDNDNDVDDEEDITSTLFTKLKLEKKDIIVPLESTYSTYYTSNKTTSPYITKFEKSKILGVRAEMLANGSVPLVNVPKNCDSVYKIAELEFNDKKIPLLIRRTLPNGKIEDWRLEEMSY
tara:strand:- start:1255 stop:1713 length:459 start_codon:yes stop_codon:yes gene_type:complete